MYGNRRVGSNKRGKNTAAKNQVTEKNKGILSDDVKGYHMPCMNLNDKLLTCHFSVYLHSSQRLFCLHQISQH